MTQEELQQIDQLLEKRLEGVATKDDLIRELSQYPTKEDLANALSNYATKNDLKQFATKDDLIALKNALETTMGNLGKEIMSAMNLGTVPSKEFNSLEKRVDSIEKQLQSA